MLFRSKWAETLDQRLPGASEAVERRRTGPFIPKSSVDVNRACLVLSMAALACACSCAGRATNVKAPASFPDGWYTAERCEGVTGDHGVYRLSRAGWMQLRGEQVTRTEARFGEEGDACAATYTAGPCTTWKSKRPTASSA